MIETLEAPVTAPLETVTPIRPSEALRLGRLVRPRHSRVTLLDGEDGACALGAMYIGMGGDPAAVGPSGEPYTEPVLTFVGDLWDLGVTEDGCGPTVVIGMRFDRAEHDGTDGDAAVLAYLESRGL